jgi:hypothetical protein
VHDAGEHVARHVELLQLFEVGELLRERADERVAADVDDRGVGEQAELGREAAVEAVVEEDDLVERFDHPAYAPGDAADELVVGDDDDGGGGVAEGLRDGPHEAVGVDEDRVEVLVEEPRGQVPLEVVEADVEVLERGHVERDRRERADEAVVADVELVQQRQPRHGLGDDAAEAVAVDVEEGEVGEEAELRREVPGDVGAVEVDPGDDRHVGVVEGLDADDAVVGADVGAYPVGRVGFGVGVEGAAPGLQRDVRAAEARVGERVGAQPVRELLLRAGVRGEVAAGLLDGEELPVSDVRGLRARQALDGGAGGGQEEERGRQAAAAEVRRRIHGPSPRGCLGRRRRGAGVIAVARAPVRCPWPPVDGRTRAIAGRHARSREEPRVPWGVVDVSPAFQEGLRLSFLRLSSHACKKNNMISVRPLEDYKKKNILLSN